jgi:dTDP-4-dehydrorhamnose reductase
MRTIWITGARGLIGNYLVQTAPAGTRVTGLSRAELDLADFAAVRRAFREQAPGVIIHCAAISKPVVCQADPALARKMNVEVTALLAELAADIPFVFFSSDLVFDGSRGDYAESAPVSPLGIYAETKVAAEKIVLANPRHTAVRTSLNGGTSPVGDRAFNEEMRRAWQEGRTPTLFTDEFRCPIPAVVTARAIWELLVSGRPGLYHLAGSERLSRYQIGELLAARWSQLRPKIRAASLKEYQGPPRAPDVSIDCSKLQKLLSFPLPSLSDWLAKNPDEVF